MLHVERAIHFDAGIQQLGDILPAALVPASGQIAVCQFVDQDHRRLSRQCSVQIELGEVASAIVHLPARQYFQPFQRRRSLGAAMRLHQADHHIHALPLQFAGGGEHGERLADAGRGAEENLQSAMALVLHAVEQSVGACFPVNVGHASLPVESVRTIPE